MIISSLKFYFKARRLGLTRKVILSHLKQTGGVLSALEVYFLLAIACATGIYYTLKYADEIDTNYQQAMQSADTFKKSAQHNEAVIVSMLNGEVELNGRTYTVRRYNAAGECVRF